MRKSLAGALVVAAMLVVATSTARTGPSSTFQATCSYTYSPGDTSLGGCAGGFSDSSFTFYGPFFGPDFFSFHQFAPFEGTPFINFGVGTTGGGFTFNGITCNYDVILGGTSCDGDVVIGAGIAPPDDTGVAPGTVVSIVGTGSMQGFFCNPCMTPAPQVIAIEVTATYQFTLTAPGTPTPWTWTGAEFTSPFPYKANVQPPINADGNSSFKSNRGVIPVKFTLTQNDMPTCTLPAATIAVTRTVGGAVGSVDERTYSMAADSGSNFRIDTPACEYIYNLGASALGVGTYRIDIIINGNVVGNAVFALK